MFTEDDFEEYATLCANPDVMRFLGGKTFDTDETWRHMAYLIGHWQLRGYGYFAAQHKQSGKLAGRIGYTNSTGWPGFELGWTLAPDFQGKGLATEGAQRLLRYAFEEMDKPHVISLIHPDNAPSIRVAKRLGEKLEGKAEIFGTTVQVYGIDRENFK